MADLGEIRNILLNVEAGRSPYDGYDKGLAFGDKKQAQAAYLRRRLALEACFWQALIIHADGEFVHEPIPIVLTARGRTFLEGAAG